MKNILKTIMIIGPGMGIFHAATAQDVDINIITSEASTTVGSTAAYVQVDICNNDPGAVSVPMYKLRPLISGSSKIEFTTVDLPTGWTVLSNDGENVRLSNGTDNTLAPGECRQIILHLEALEIGNVTFTGTMAFSNGTAPGDASGPSTEGDLPGNNNSISGLAIEDPTPVNWLYFNAQVQDGDALLSWSTASEKNCSGFDIQRSSNSTDWNTLGRVDSRSLNGNSDQPMEYSYTDQHPLAGSNFYRIRQKDINGSYSYSQIRTLGFQHAESISLFPNPAADQLNIKGIKNRDKVRIISLAGQVLLEHQAVSDQVAVGIKDLSAGVYLVQVLKGDEIIYSGKFTKVN